MYNEKSSFTMKKVVLKICSVAFCCGVLVINVFIGGNNSSSKDVNLRGLSVSVYAKSCPEGPLPSGKCSTFSGNCYGNPGGPWDCDITVWNPW
jgi:hypothetical protein